MAREIFVIGTPPSGRKSISNAIQWMSDVNRSIDDTTELWKGMEPDIKKSVKNEFSESNPNKWSAITQDWRKRKTFLGYPVTIGVATGALREAVGDKANVMYSRHYMQWDVNGDISAGAWGGWGKPVSDYVGYFNARREIFVATKEFIEKKMQIAVRKFVESITMRA